MKKPPEDLADKLIAASAQFSGTGLDVSVEDVAEASGVPRATLYYYFAGREDIVDFYLGHKLDSVATAIEKAAAGEGTTVERLAAITRAVLAAMVAQPALCTELPEALRRRRTQFSEVAAKADQVMRSPIRDILIEGRANGELNVPDIDVTIDALHGALGQVALMQLMRHGTFDPDLLADQLIPVMLTGLAHD